MQAMLEVDEHHWWYRGRRRIIRAELERLPLRAGARVLDAGCGSGRTLDELADYGEVHGIELDPQAAEAARARRQGEVEVGRLEELPWDDATFDLITCLDVIEHTPDDRVTLAELRRVCKPGGWLLVTVPAYQALWSLHDDANHHYRRYERATLRSAAARRRLADRADDVVQQRATATGRGRTAGPAAPAPRPLHARDHTRPGMAEHGA